MSIGKIISSIQSGFSSNAFAKQHAKVEKYFRINDYDTFGDSFDKMYTAKDTIANYAKSKGVRIDVYDAQKAYTENACASESGLVDWAKESLADKIRVIATNLSNGKKQEKLVSARTDAFYPKLAERDPMIIPVEPGNTERVITPFWKTEDNFIRNLYRNIESLAEAVTK